MKQEILKKEGGSTKVILLKEVFGTGKHWKVNAQKVKNELRKNLKI